MLPARFKIIVLHAYFVFLLVLLYLSKNKIADVGIFLMYLSTLIIVLHVWLGAYYIIKYLKPSENIINYILDLFLLGFLLAVTAYFHKLVIWSILLACLFSLVMVKYVVIRYSTLDKKVKEYTIKKIRNEIYVVPLLILLAAFAHLFKNNELAIFLLQVIVLLFQIFFAVWIIFIKKVYSIFN